LKQREEILLIDVRTSAEFDRSHIPGAIHIPLRDIEDGSGIKTIQNLQQKQSKKIVTYCHSGQRSHRAIDRLNQAGISATNLTGGIVQWRTVIDPNLKLPNS
jgi:rhodanese-related sulfurtransferase